MHNLASRWSTVNSRVWWRAGDCRRRDFIGRMENLAVGRGAYLGLLSIGCHLTLINSSFRDSSHDAGFRHQPTAPKSGINIPLQYPHRLEYTHVNLLSV